MEHNVVLALLVASFITCILEPLGKCPGWVSRLLLIVAVFLLAYK